MSQPVKSDEPTSAKVLDPQTLGELPGISSRRYLTAGAALVGAAMLLVAEGIVFDHLGLREHLLSYDLVAHDHPNTGETKLFLLQLLLGTPAMLLVCRAGLELFSPREPSSLLTRLSNRSRRTAIFSAVAAALAVVVIRLVVFRGSVFSDDERVYVYEARALLAGDLTTRAPGPLRWFAHQFLLELPEGRWAGVYPVGQPALLAVGMMVGIPFLTQVLCGAGIVYLGARLAERLWSAKVGVVTALLLATSPFLLCMSATLHNTVPTTFLLLAALLAAFRIRDGGGLGFYTAAGTALAAMQLIRQLEALFAVVAVGVLLLPLTVKATPERRRHILGLAIVFTLCVMSVFVQLESNATITGSPLVSPYTVFARAWPGAKLFGFGVAGFGAVATFPGAVTKTVAVLMRLSAWCFGWPASLVPFALACAGFGATDRWVRAAIAFVLLHATAYFFLVIGAVHDIGSAYHLFDLPFITMVSAAVLVGLGERLTPLGAALGALPARLSFAASIVAAATFWPQEMSRLAHVASIIRAPVEAAQAYAGGESILLFWDRIQSPGPFTSWVYFPPPPGPNVEDKVLWVRSGAYNEQIARAFPARKACFLRWDENGHPFIVGL
jgi:hypothetical protein